MRRWDRQTDGRQTVTLRLPLDADSVKNAGMVQYRRSGVLQGLGSGPPSQSFDSLRFAANPTLQGTYSIGINCKKLYLRH